MGGMASCSHCVQDDRDMMWSMLTGNEVACTCLYMYSAVDVGTSKECCVCYKCHGDDELEYEHLNSSE